MGKEVKKMATTEKKKAPAKAAPKEEKAAVPAKPSLAEMIKEDPNTGVQVMANRLRNYSATYATLSDVTEPSPATLADMDEHGASFEFHLAGHRYLVEVKALGPQADVAAPEAA
jgi:hypothetical protein